MDEITSRRVKQEELVWATSLLAAVQARKFFGTLQMTFRNGHLITVEESRTLKPPCHTEGLVIDGPGKPAGR